MQPLHRHATPASQEEKPTSTKFLKLAVQSIAVAAQLSCAHCRLPKITALKGNAGAQITARRLIF
jgi:hypothetical protein